MDAMRYSVVLIPEDDGRVSVLVPALPGCVSMGNSHAEALAHVREAILGWLETEVAAGNQPPAETPATVAAGVAEALEIIEQMRAAGERALDRGYDLSVATVEIPPLVTV